MANARRQGGLILLFCGVVLLCATMNALTAVTADTIGGISSTATKRSSTLSLAFSGNDQA
jgi:hypothetical protein